MAQSGEAAAAIKKAADAKPKVSTKKLLKDLAVNAAMFVGPGKFVKGVKAVEEGVAIARGVRGTQKARGVTNAIRPKIPKPDVREVITEPRVLPKTKLPRGVKPVSKPKTKTPSLLEKNKGGGQKTTTGQRRVKVSDTEAKAIAQEVGRRPIAPRPRLVKKGSGSVLSASEKRSQSQIGTVTRPKPKRPLKLAEIKANKASERRAKFEKLLTPVKPIGEKRPGRVTSTKLSGPKRPELPAHKVDVKVMRKKKWTPDTSNAGAEAEPLARGAGKGESGARVTTTYKSKAEIAEEGRNAAQSPQNTFAARPKTDISKGRGNVPQPKSVTKTGDAATVRGERIERIQQIKASRGGPKFIKKTKSGQTVSVSKIDSPRNAASNKLIMEKRVQEGEAEADKVSKKLNASKDAKIKKNTAKVDKTLAEAQRAKESRSLQNTFNKPVFQRKPSTGKLTVTRPIKPTK